MNRVQLLDRRNLRIRFLAFGVVLFVAAVHLLDARAQIVLTNCSEGTLRSALFGGGVVRFDCDTTLTLTNTISISTNTVLDGEGRTVTISGGNAVRLFDVAPNVTLTLRNLRLMNGQHGGNATNTNQIAIATGLTAQGGAIYNRGTLVLVETQFAGNSAEGTNGKVGDSSAISSGKTGQHGGHGLGGAVFNDRGLLIVTNSVFLANSAKGGEGGNGGDGGAFGNGNHGGDGGDGGGGSGGAIFNLGGVVQIFDSSFASNHVAGAVAGFGGFAAGMLGFEGANGKGGQGRGGAILNEGGTITIHNSTFAVNTGIGVTGNDGLPGRLANDGEDGEDGSAALGGGIFQWNGTLKIVNSTFSGSILIGGNAGNGGAGGVDGFGGDGGDGGEGGRAAGGGLYVIAGVAEIINATFAGNTLNGGNGGGAGDGGGFTGRDGNDGASGRTSGAGIENESGTVVLKNSLLANGGAAGNASGMITDGGHNLSSDLSARFTASGSLNNVDPKLGLLGDNGGRTQTIGLSANSPAIDAGNPAFCLGSDQRRARYAGPCDIGAFELNGQLTGVPLAVRFDPAGGLQISWPATTDLLLERTDSLAEPVLWNAVTNLPVRVQGENSILLAPSNRTGFFRLRKR